VAPTDPARLRNESGPHNQHHTTGTGTPRCSDAATVGGVHALLAFSYDWLRYGRGFGFVIIIAISAIVRLAKRSRSGSSTSVTSQYQPPPQQFPPGSQQPYQQQFPPGSQQPGYARPYQQQPGYPPPPPMGTPPAPVSPFAAPQSNPLAPNPNAAPTDRPRSTPISSFGDEGR